MFTYFPTSNISSIHRPTLLDVCGRFSSLESSDGLTDEPLEAVFFLLVVMAAVAAVRWAFFSENTLLLGNTFFYKIRFEKLNMSKLNSLFLYWYWYHPKFDRI